MKDKQFNLFLILKGLNDRTPIHAFIAPNYDNARMYFHNFINNMQEKHKYHLYKIGTINKDLKVDECHYYITSGYSTTKEIAYQKKFDIFNEKKLIEMVATNAIKKPTSQIIKEFFIGREV